MTLLRLLVQHRMMAVKLGTHQGVSYAHFIGAELCVSGYGETTEDAIWSAVAKMPRARA